MNLETLVERACLESGYNDTDDVAAGKKFARHWDEHIWNAALWKAALVACDVSIDPTTNEDHAEGIVFLPEVVDRVVAVRCANNQLAVRGQEHHYQMDYDAFAATGQPVEFHILPPGWLTVRSTTWELSVPNISDQTVEMAVIYYDQSGTQSGQRRKLTGVYSALNADTDLNGVHLIERVFKPETAGTVLLVEDGVTTLGALASTDTASPLYQRIRLLPTPTAAFTLKVLGKAKYEPLDFDQQESALRNCVPALLAFVRGSLKRRGGEVAAAQLEFEEGNALLRQVMQVEALQAANNQRFMPEAGYGPDHGLGPMNLT